ncbi:hypothetical protein EJ576_10815 [Pseudomonas sp. C 49-2]|uniref:hypothetical protein n=1 Tax=Pseudomonas TaxID=286 RepID=UPI000F816591|nr:hypothetical protein [Pseudomonas sp. C 49-2]RTY00788.1 hypothetical protein EJ576_10815 [Pseudomonas sp. C 49-2]
MVWESESWKVPLLKLAKRLASLKASRELSEDQLALIERDIFIGFYSVRKLTETPTKVTDQTRTMLLAVSKFANLKPVTWRNNHRLDQLYNLNKSNQEKRDIPFVCGRIIHSFIFAPCVSEEGGLCGVFFTSDLDKDKFLLFMDIDEMIALFRQVGNDNPSVIESSRDLVTGVETLIVK